MSLRIAERWGEGDDLSMVKYDFFAQVMLAMTYVLMTVLPWIHEPVPPIVQERIAGKITVEWPGESSVDVDLHVLCRTPDHLQHLYYLYPNTGRYVYLDQDSRGYRKYRPHDNVNREVAKFRGTRLAGDMTCYVNLYHWGFNNAHDVHGFAGEPTQVDVGVVLYLGSEEEGYGQVVLYDSRTDGEIELQNPGDEVTVVRFRTDRDGRFVEGSDDFQGLYPVAAAVARG